MEISTEIKKNIRYQTVKGAVDTNGLITHMKQIYSAPGFNPNMYAFWDFHEADFSNISTEEIREFMEFVSKHWGKDGNAKAAVIAPANLGFGLARMYEGLMELSTSSKVSIFRDTDEAKAWISQNE